MQNFRCLLIASQSSIRDKFSKLLARDYDLYIKNKENTSDFSVLIDSFKPNLVVIELNNAGYVNSLELANKLASLRISFIFLAQENLANGIYNLAKNTNPEAILYEDYSEKINLNRLNLTIERLIQRKFTSIEKEVRHKNESICFTDNSKLVTLKKSDILFSKAERNYCKIFTKTKAYFLCMPLKKIETKIQSQQMMRIHRSFLINLNAIDEHYGSTVVKKDNQYQ